MPSSRALVRELLREIGRWQSEGEEVALATLVRVDGSAPSGPGARLACTRSGRMAGSVGPGCVESDVFLRALEVLGEGAPARARYGIADETALEIGLSCGGSIELLIEPFAADEAWRALVRAVEAERPVALATALSPAALRGRRLAVDAEGVRAGSIDAALDEPARAAAQGQLAAGGTRVVELPWQDGVAELFLEAVGPPERLYVVGATQIAAALSRMAPALGFQVTIIDARTALATRARFPDAAALVHEWPGEALAAARLDAGAYVVVLTHDPKFDVPALVHALRSRARYVGALGSRRTDARRRDLLREQGLSDAELVRLRAPIGLDLGGREPAEVALAILAEIQTVRYGHEGAALCLGSGPIHGG